MRRALPPRPFRRARTQLRRPGPMSRPSCRPSIGRPCGGFTATSPQPDPSDRSASLPGEAPMTSSSKWLASFVALGLSTPAVALAADWPAVARALGKEGAEQPGGVYRVGLPRSDLKVVLDGVELKPALALGSWVAFKEMGDQAMVMGDLVLTSRGQSGDEEPGRWRDRDHRTSQPSAGTPSRRRCSCTSRGTAIR